MPQQNRRTMLLEELVTALTEITAGQPRQERFSTPIESFTVSRTFGPKKPSPTILKQPAICLTVQGAKWAISGEERLVYKAGHALVIAVATPARSAVATATPERPYLGLTIRLDLTTLRDVAQDACFQKSSRKVRSSQTAFVLEVGSEVLDCSLRALRLLNNPEAIPVLLPGIMREMCFWLLCSPEREHFMMMARGKSEDQQVIRIMLHIQQMFRKKLGTDALARLAGMSPETFRRRFRAVAAMSPLSYQKNLRLLEGRRLIVLGGAGVEQAAYEVGYQSASHFSRDYSRYFGRSPRIDAASWTSS